MLVDRHLEAGTSVPRFRIKIDAQIILRHHLDLALEAARDHAVSGLASALETMRGALRLSNLPQLPRPLANLLGWQLTGQPRRRRIAPHGKRKNVQIRKRQSVQERE